MLGCRIICYIGVGLDLSLRIEVGRSSGGVLNTDFADESDAEMFWLMNLVCVLRILRQWIRGEVSFFCAFFLFL